MTLNCLISHPGQIDFSDPRFTPENEFRCGAALDLLRKQNNENIIVNGEMLVFDMTGFSTKHIARMNHEIHREVNKIYQVIAIIFLLPCHSLYLFVCLLLNGK